MKTAVFIKSNNSLEGLPRDQLPEIAVLGRSNVGKSSLINLLTGAAKAETTCLLFRIFFCSNPNLTCPWVWVNSSNSTIQQCSHSSGKSQCR